MVYIFGIMLMIINIILVAAAVVGIFALFLSIFFAFRG